MTSEHLDRTTVAALARAAGISLFAADIAPLTAAVQQLTLATSALHQVEFCRPRRPSDDAGHDR
ncbi:hypothetical protein G3I59_37630 [Amycolatopsis rubida]|uniref:Uncharacterized protein n=1 Tax=Amycolatopsis rubida TaxID=112413 RepID=A0ABX0C007_9PSEU|nr:MULTISPECIES: hypothetical protein [Amycolatopsis]MYW96179.1 hypothetical protein [Amycolatopsis rubida]NEC61170.1 hypothetical protein [Amycolatopsis rubida]OAP24305.1 hypothetical protein A4R44_05078 [Amycolatopsis sp. M39]